MAKKGFRSLTIKQEVYDLLEEIAEEKGTSLSSAVALVTAEFHKRQKEGGKGEKETLPYQ